MATTDGKEKDGVDGELAEVGPGDLRTDVLDALGCVTSLRSLLTSG